MREEFDSLGKVLVPEDKLWGAQTQRSIDNFKIGVNTNKMPIEIIQAYAVLKKSAAAFLNKPPKLSPLAIASVMALPMFWAN